jgi:hypothetical protein
MLKGERDFLSGVLKSGFFATEPAALPIASAHTSEWCVRSAVEILKVATAASPNISMFGAASEMGLRTGGELSSPWHQVVRACPAVTSPETPPVMRSNPWP